jgi:hypothetical protein
MSLSPLKYKILEHMLLNDKPARAVQIAKESGNDFKPVMMHLIGLTRMGYTASPEKGQYVITQKGKKALGIPEINKERAKEILAQTSREKAFHFYVAMDKPVNLIAYGLKDFSEKIQTVAQASLEFHLGREDFQKWFTSLGDAELAKKMSLLKQTGIVGEQLREKLRETVESRCVTLSTLT